MSDILTMRGTPVHVALLCVLATSSGGCYRSHTRVDRIDGGRDASFVDAQPLDLLDDAEQADLGDASIDMALLECPNGLAGTWYAAYGHSCLGTDGFIELSESGLPSLVDGICARPGCNTEDCEVVAPVAPGCASFVRWTSPCWGAPRGVSTEISYHFLSATRFEGTWTLITPGSRCEEHLIGTR